MSVTNPTVRPELADVYFNWSAQAAAAPTVATASTLAVAATDNWGPVNTPVLLTSYDGPAPVAAGDDAGYLGVFGDSDTQLRRAVFGGFKGHGYNGLGGAGSIIAVRIAGSSAAAGAITLKNTATTNALTLTAKYPGTRINEVSITVQAGTGGGDDELLVIDGSTVAERYDYTSTDIASVAALINELSDFFTATVLVDAVALALVSSSAVTGGNDGLTLVGGDWTNTMNALDRTRWQYFGAYGVTDGATIASLVAWIQLRNENGLRCMLGIGGATAETLATAITRTAGINDYQVINLGVGTLHLTDDDRDCSTAEFVTRYLGARAFRGEAMGDIFMRFADVDMTVSASLTEQQQALESGVVVFSRDTNADAPVYIREARNTYIDDSISPLDTQGQKEHPVALYSVIKNIAIQQGIELEIGDWARTGLVLGALPVNDKDRQLVLGRIQIAYSNRETAQVVQTGWSVALAANQSDDNDYIEYVHGFKPTRSLRQIFNTARIG